MSEEVVFKDLINDWTDTDVAAHALCCCLGIMPKQSAMMDAKWVYWSDNILGNKIIELLDHLVEIGFLECRWDSGYQYRIASDFQKTFEIEDIHKEFS